MEFTRRNSADQDKKLAAEKRGEHFFPRVVVEKAGYRVEVDYVSATVAYIGKAEPEVAFDGAGWQVAQLTTEADGSCSLKYANGSARFDLVWDDRLTYTY